MNFSTNVFSSKNNLKSRPSDSCSWHIIIHHTDLMHVLKEFPALGLVHLVLAFEVGKINQTPHVHVIFQTFKRYNINFLAN